MSEPCYCDVQVFGKMEDVERFKSILDGDDKEYTTYFCDHSDSCNDIEPKSPMAYEGHARWATFGEVNFTADHLFEDKHDGEIDNGKEVASFLKLSGILNLTIELYCENCADEFNEYYSVSNGEVLRKDSVYWSDPGIFEDDDHDANIEEFEYHVQEALDFEIPLDMTEVEAIRKDNYANLEEMDEFSFGGYDWRDHSEKEILNKVEPTVRRAIQRD